MRVHFAVSMQCLFVLMLACTSFTKTDSPDAGDAGTDSVLARDTSADDTETDEPDTSDAGPTLRFEDTDGNVLDVGFDPDDTSTQTLTFDFTMLRVCVRGADESSAIGLELDDDDCFTPTVGATLEADGHRFAFSVRPLRYLHPVTRVPREAFVQFGASLACRPGGGLFVGAPIDYGQPNMVVDASASGPLPRSRSTSTSPIAGPSRSLGA